MPNPNGIQLYYRLKAINPNVRIIFVTALDVIKDELALLPGFSPDYDLIKKPLERENYINRIKQPFLKACLVMEYISKC